MRPLARELLNGREDTPVRLVYGTVTAENTVRLDGETTAVVLPAIIPVETGQRAVVLKSGGDRVIVGPVDVNQIFAGGVASATTDVNGIVTITHGLPWTPVGVVASPRSTNTSQHRVDNVGATTFRYRAWARFGDPVATDLVTFQWLAFK